MTDTPEIPTTEEAVAELETLQVWLQDFEQRKQQLQGVIIRSAFLQGLLADPSKPPVKAAAKKRAD